MTDSIAGIDRREGRSWNRATVAQVVESHAAGREAGRTQAEVAEEWGVARTTLGHWLQRQRHLASSAKEAAFFESPEGLEVLHRLVVAAHVVISFAPKRGIRGVGELLELSGLSVFVGSSYGAQQTVAAQIEEELVRYGEQMKARLGAEMPRRTVTVAQDETFHPAICLVGLDAGSGFVLVERYAEQRDAQSWNTAMSEGLQGLNVEVIQSTSDEGTGLLKHVREGLGVHHSPDLFHIQQDVAAGLFRTLEVRQRQATREVEQAARLTAIWQEAQEREQQAPPRRPTHVSEYLDQARQEQARAEQARADLDTQHEQIKQTMQVINDAYHPFDLNTGQVRSVAQVETTLQRSFDTLDQIGKRLDLGQAARKRLDKARRGLPQMLATLVFVFRMITGYVEELALPEAMEQALTQKLIPAFYLRRIAAVNGKTAAERHVLEATAEPLLEPLRGPHGPFAALSPQDRAHVEQAAWDCAHLFQRSSSAVEGRNGQLSFWHQHLRQLRPQRLQALTVVQNYLATRPDGSTAAERFFGAKPEDLFQWLLQRVRLPPRPATKRPRPPPQPVLQFEGT